MAWLKQCRYEVQNLANLRFAIEQYMDVIRMVNHEYREKAMNLANYLAEDKERFLMAKDVSRAYAEARKQVGLRFFDEVVEQLRSELGSEWVVEIQGNLASRHGTPLQVRKNEWGSSPALVIGLEFERGDFHDCYLGVVRTSKDVEVQGGSGSEGIVQAFREELKGIGPLDTTDWWLHWEWFQRGDVVEHIVDGANAHEELVRKLLGIADRFEGRNGLLSKINAWVKSSRASTA